MDLKEHSRHRVTFIFILYICKLKAYWSLLKDLFSCKMDSENTKYPIVEQTEQEHTCSTLSTWQAFYYQHYLTSLATELHLERKIMKAIPIHNPMKTNIRACNNRLKTPTWEVNVLCHLRKAGSLRCTLRAAGEEVGKLLVRALGEHSWLPHVWG